jgi:bloom syndrome protein
MGGLYTLNQCVDAYRGSSNKKSLELMDNPYYGNGKELKIGECERLFKKLIVEGALIEQIRTNRAGFASSYVKIGPHYSKVLNGSLKIEMCEGEEVVKGEKKEKRTKSKEKSVLKEGKKKFPWTKRKNKRITI